jgi:hypothetical protein
MTDWSCWRNRPAASLAAKPSTAVLISRSARAAARSGRPPSRSYCWRCSARRSTASAAATLARPAAGQHFTGSGVGAYSLTPAAWAALTTASAAQARATGAWQGRGAGTTARSA